MPVRSGSPNVPRTSVAELVGDAQVLAEGGQLAVEVGAPGEHGGEAQRQLERVGGGLAARGAHDVVEGGRQVAEPEVAELAVGAEADRLVQQVEEAGDDGGARAAQREAADRVDEGEVPGEQTGRGAVAVRGGVGRPCERACAAYRPATFAWPRRTWSSSMTSSCARNAVWSDSTASPAASAALRGSGSVAVGARVS